MVLVLIFLLPLFSWNPAARAQGADEPPALAAEESEPEAAGPEEPAQEASPEAEEPESFEDILARQDGQEFEHEGRTYVWRDGRPFEKNEDGTLTAVEAPENLYEVDSQGLNWLSLEADGTFYIEVAPRVLASINFAHNSDVIEEDSRPVLDVLGHSLNSPGLIRHRMIIAGHTNNLGNPEYNLKLSRRRAAAVSRYLAETHGLDPERLILHGYGDTRPLADNETEEGRDKNRRVEFILLGPARDGE